MTPPLLLVLFCCKIRTRCIQSKCHFIILHPRLRSQKVTRYTSIKGINWTIWDTQLLQLFYTSYIITMIRSESSFNNNNGVKYNGSHERIALLTKVTGMGIAAQWGEEEIVVDLPALQLDAGIQFAERLIQEIPAKTKPG